MFFLRFGRLSEKLGLIGLTLSDGWLKTDQSHFGKSRIQERNFVGFQGQVRVRSLPKNR